MIWMWIRVFRARIVAAHRRRKRLGQHRSPSAKPSI